MDDLIRSLGEDGSVRRGLAISKIKRMGPEAARAAPCLLDCLDDPDPNIRYTAIQALGEIAPQDAIVIDRLSRLLKAPDSKIRRFALESLAKGGENTPIPVLRDVRSARLDDNELVRLYADLAYLSLCTTDEINDSSFSAIISGLHSSNRNVQNNAVWVVGELAPRSRMLVPLPVEMLDKLESNAEDAHLCALIAGALWQFPGDARVATPRLRERLDDFERYQTQLEQLSDAWHGIGMSRLRIWAAIEGIESASGDADKK